MARAKSSAAKKKTKRAPSRSGRRALWKGSINFGLVNIPVALYTAESSNDLDFDLLDRRNFSPVHYKRVNAKTGQEVPWDDIIKGYQYEKGEYVALTEQDFKKANVEATQSIDIMSFVDASEISPMYFDKPYYLEPQKAGRRAYALLREVLEKTGKVGIAKVVIRSRQHLPALMVQGSVLVLEILRFPHELRDASGIDVPESGRKAGFSEQEFKMAEHLVEMMGSDWEPDKYRDEYRDDLLKLIEQKVKSGKTHALDTTEPKVPRERGAKVVDIMSLLKQSVNQARKTQEPPRRRKAS
jgi:DNA end-binding protein Ku